MKKNRLFIFLIFLTILFLVFGCSKKTKVTKNTRFIMNTIITIDVYGESEEKNNQASLEALDIMQNFSDKANRYKRTSEVTYINENAGVTPVEVSPDIFEILSFLSKQKYKGVDVTVGPLVDLWSFYRKNNNLPDKNSIENVLSKVDFQKVILDEQKNTVFLKEKGMNIDLGAVAKGWAVEEASKVFLNNKNITGAIINGGGNIKIIGKKEDGNTWRIGIQDPRDADKYLGVLLLNANDACATSGDYQRNFELGGVKYHHLLDVKTGYPAKENISSTAITKNAFVADYYSTLLFFMPAEKAMDLIKENPDIDAIIVTKDNKVYISSGIKKRFEKNEETKYEFIYI